MKASHTMYESSKGPAIKSVVTERERDLNRNKKTQSTLYQHMSKNS